MKITSTIMALLAAGFVGHSALGSDDINPSLTLAVAQDGHGGSRFMYRQTDSQDASASVALSTSSGGVGNGPAMQQSPQADGRDLKVSVGNNQHAEPTTAYIPATTQFTPTPQR